MRTTNLTSSWYTTSFISNTLKEYLIDQSYRIIDENEEVPLNCDDVIVASKFFGKEIIEVRGTLENDGTKKEETESSKRTRLFTDAMYWLSDVLLSPITFFANHYNDGTRSLCLPDLEQYRELLEKVREYFNTNNLNLKVYLVNERGDVRITYLNELSGGAEEIDDEPI